MSLPDAKACSSLTSAPRWCTQRTARRLRTVPGRCPGYAAWLLVERATILFALQSLSLTPFFLQRYTSWIVLYVTGKGVFQHVPDGDDALEAEYGVRAAKQASAARKRMRGDDDAPQDDADGVEEVKLTKLCEVCGHCRDE